MTNHQGALVFLDGRMASKSVYFLQLSACHPVSEHIRLGIYINGRYFQFGATGVDPATSVLEPDSQTNEWQGGVRLSWVE